MEQLKGDNGARQKKSGNPTFAMRLSCHKLCLRVERTTAYCACGSIITEILFLLFKKSLTNALIVSGV